MPLTEDIQATTVALEAAADGFKKMQIALLVFAFIVTLSTIAIGVCIYKIQLQNE